MACRLQGACCRQVQAGSWFLFAGFALLGWTGAPVSAADIETRDFTVKVDGKRAGDVHMTIHRQDDGTSTMSCDTDLKVSHLLVNYKYSYRGQEIWKAGRLVRFDSTCNDDGKYYVVSAVAESNGLRISVNNQVRMARPDVWLTSYWCLPDPKIRNQVIPLIDADTGRDLSGQLQYLGDAQMAVAGQVQNVQHFRLSGKVFVDLWYDAGERLVRQEWIEDGHRTLLELTGVRR